MSKTIPSTPAAPAAMADFACLDSECQATVSVNLLELKKQRGRISCSACHREYQFEPAFLDKLEKLRRLVDAVRDAADILGDVHVGIATPAGEVKIPYWLMLTRMNTVFTLDMAGQKIEFHFRVESVGDGAFR